MAKQTKWVMPAANLSNNHLGREVEFPWTFRGHRTYTTGKVRTIEHREDTVRVTLHDEKKSTMDSHFVFLIDPQADVTVEIKPLTYHNGEGISDDFPE